MLEKIFKLQEKGTTVKTEILAGVTTFLAMAYILAVNPAMLGETGMSVQGVFLATAISSAVATIIMGLIANYPVALSAGMGVNALFTYTICGTMGLSYKGALACVFVSGIIFVVISVTGLRRMIINAIPAQLKLAIGAGIGFFIAFIGLKNAGIIIASPATFVSLGDFTQPAVILAIFGILVTILLLSRKVPAAVFYGLLVTAVAGIIAGLCGIKGMPTLPNAVVSAEFDFSLVGVFASGMDELLSHPSCFVAIFSLLFVDFFDTAGTLVAVANRANLIDDKGELENVERALLADSIGTVFGSVMGTSTVTSFVESTSGVEVGGRTGLTALTTGILFLLSVFFSPLLAAVTSAVTAPALVVVGILMAQQLKGIDWDNFVYAASGFMTVLFMILAYSISDGIAIGFITYALTMVGVGKAKEVKPIVWVLVVFFVIFLVFLPK
ncbi:MAG: NCS2 family permease [Longibaculum muris]|uniref:AGZA family xanthine/uracil permease-like MFS transporter n=1 Tax=Longibaculum muris TaxID=1796628 RepID=A0A4R3Z6Y7_9FIRM|nr:NCS2 family permease [Longibaculum muris]KXU45695.1 guanine/hypoxanthine permease PbuG [Candidatus Stoquefichus sp. KLE1796]MBS5368181.1 NCS2 family permease [Coprobacillus cateniformis]MCR1886537.1 NCS2 family permease [Longibaculum muris]MED9813011.1 NCS2 family permease [Longibaculum muris]TCW01589.1 AGZA family xanthine/uracil permease-like MFS transporter [Longibaculum muris]